MTAFLPSQPPLADPSTGKRLLRRPDLRQLWSPRASGQPLTPDEVDYDEVAIHRSWRAFDPDQPGVVRYFMFEFSQKNPGSDVWVSAVKAVRMVRLTRVPRYLRMSTSSSGAPSMVFDQQRDVMAALRQEQVLFVNMIAHSPELPLIFAYGVQAVGADVTEAQYKADEAYAVLTGQLDGTYQQLQYAPITLAEADHIVRYQAEWDQIAAARGRPLPSGASLGAGALLDGNRTDVENANNQLESFIRGMSSRSFLLSLITVPLAPAEISLAWRNIANQLSDARSEQSGSRSVTAGIALPMAMAANVGTDHGTNHSTGLADGVGRTDALSHSVSDSQTYGLSQGTSQSVSDSQTYGVSHGTSQSVADTVTHGVTHGQSVSLADSLSHTQGASVSHGDSVSLSNSLSHTMSDSVSRGQNQSMSQGVTDTVSAGANWANSVNQNTSASVGQSNGLSVSRGDSLNQAVNVGHTFGDSLTSGWTRTDGSQFGGGIGLSGGQNTSLAQQLSQQLNNSHTVGSTLTGGTTLTNGFNLGQNSSLTQGVTTGETAGGSIGQSQSVANTASFGESVGRTMGVSDGITRGLSQGQTQTAGLSDSLASGTTATQGLSASNSATAGRTMGAANSLTESATAGRTLGTSNSLTESATAGRTLSDGVSQAISQNRALNDAFMTSMARSQGMSGSLGVVPSFGVSVSRQTLNASKQIVGDVLESQMRRYLDGIEGGAFLYQMFLVAPDRETLLAGSGLLKSAFWGPGSADRRLPQPFHVMSDIEPAEAARLRTHATLLTSYRRRETRMELIEPFAYSSYVTAAELGTMCYPPTAESLGLMAQADSMPVLAMPADRDRREITLGRIVNGERAVVSDQSYGIDISELTHVLIAGATGSGKTTTLSRLLYEATRIRQRVTSVAHGETVARTREVPAGILALDWMRNMRNLAQCVEPERFRFYSISHPDLGAFRWNPIAVPDDTMDVADWLQLQADNFVASMNLGEFGRSLIVELLDDLLRANRLEATVLSPEIIDEDGHLVRAAVVLPAIDPATLPAGAIATDAHGQTVANAYTCPALSRLIGMEHLATVVSARIESLADPRTVQMYGRAYADRIQSLWRRVQYFAPGNKLAEVLTYDPDLTTRRCLTVAELVDPNRGLVSVVETDGLDLANRRLVLGSVLLAVYRLGLHYGEGTYDHDGNGPGTLVVLEEAHELFGDQGEDEDRVSAGTRVALYESLFRRARALGLRLIAVAQNPGEIPAAVTSNTTTVFAHRVYDDEDRKRIFSLLNWSNQITQQQREWRYLGEMPQGYCIARLDAKGNYLESQPVQFLTDPPPLRRLSDAELATWVAARTGA